MTTNDEDPTEGKMGLWAEFVAPIPNDLTRWKAALSKACLKIEDIGCSPELTELVTMVGDVIFEIQHWQGYGLTASEQESAIERYRRYRDQK